jgi:hypothetical protein
MCDGGGRVGAVEVAEVVEVLDEVVGHPTGLLLAISGEQRSAAVHWFVRIIDDRQGLTLAESFDRI